MSGVKNTYIISLGSNIGNRQKNLQNALNFLNSGQLKLLSVSKSYEYEPWGFESENQFLNLVCCVESELEPLELLKLLKDYEKNAGRKTVDDKQGYSDRLIDLDIIFCNSDIVRLPELIIPHPRMENRKFVLEPLNEIQPDFIHPVLQIRISELYERIKHE